MALSTVPPAVPLKSTSAQLAALLDSPEIERLIAELEATRWTGRPGSPIRTMIGLCLVKSLYALPTWTKATDLVADHWRLQRVLGCEGNPPSKWAAYRFGKKLRENAPAVERCIDSVVEGLKAKLPTYGTDLRHRPRHRRERHAGLRQRPTLRLQGRPGTQLAYRPGCELGTSVGRVHPQRRWLLRLQVADGLLRFDRAAGRVDGRDGQGQRVAVRRLAALHGQAPGCDGGDLRDGQGL